MKKNCNSYQKYKLDKIKVSTFGDKKISDLTVTVNAFNDEYVSLLLGKAITTAHFIVQPSVFFLLAPVRQLKGISKVLNETKIKLKHFHKKSLFFEQTKTANLVRTAHDNANCEPPLSSVFCRDSYLTTSPVPAPAAAVRQGVALPWVHINISLLCYPRCCVLISVLTL